MILLPQSVLQMYIMDKRHTLRDTHFHTSCHRHYQSHDLTMGHQIEITGRTKLIIILYIYKMLKIMNCFVKNSALCFPFVKVVLLLLYLFSISSGNVQVC